MPKKMYMNIGNNSNTMNIINNISLNTKNNASINTSQILNKTLSSNMINRIHKISPGCGSCGRSRGV